MIVPLPMIHCCLCLVRIILMDLALSLRWFCQRALLFIFAQKMIAECFYFRTPLLMCSLSRPQFSFLMRECGSKTSTQCPVCFKIRHGCLQRSINLHITTLTTGQKFCMNSFASLSYKTFLDFMYQFPKHW